MFIERFRHVLENILLFALFHFSHLHFILFYCLIFFFISLQLSHKRQSQSRGPAHSTRSESDARSQPAHALQIMNVREI